MYLHSLQTKWKMLPKDTRNDGKP